MQGERRGDLFEVSSVKREGVEGQSCECKHKALRAKARNARQLVSCAPIHGAALLGSTPKALEAETAFKEDRRLIVMDPVW